MNEAWNMRPCKINDFDPETMERQYAWGKQFDQWCSEPFDLSDVESSETFGESWIVVRDRQRPPKSLSLSEFISQHRGWSSIDEEYWSKLLIEAGYATEYPKETRDE